MTPPATAAAAHRARPAAPPRRGSGPIPRRMSGALRPAPAGPALPRRPIGVPRPKTGAPLAAGLGRRLRELPDHHLLDRVIGGRVWIPLVAFLLLGLVTMQVSLLKLNAGIGHAVERQALLQRENAALRASNGRLSSGERVRAAAQAAGLRDPAAGTVRFLRHRRDDAQLAVARMVVPSALVAAAAAAATTPQGTTTTAAAPAAASPVAATPVAPVTPTTTSTSTAGATPTTSTVTPATTPSSATSATSPVTPATTVVPTTYHTTTPTPTATGATASPGGATP